MVKKEKTVDYMKDKLPGHNITEMDTIIHTFVKKIHFLFVRVPEVIVGHPITREFLATC